MSIQAGIVLSLLCACGGVSAGELRTFAGCALIETDWADGDSFQVRFPDGKRHTLRLYGVDCFEWHVTDTTDARRLRAQRRYFGISGFGGEASASIAKAKSIGQAAGLRVRELLEKEFTVTTGFADARGDGKHPRIYGFVTLADGRDLGEVLVGSGLARAFGVYRGRPGVQTSDEYRERLKDLELRAAKLGVGAWEFTDWETLPAERKLERDEEAALAVATDRHAGKATPAARSVDPNNAPRDLLMTLPGIGEQTANRIIEHREDGPYKRAEDLDRVPGIGPKTIENIREYLRIGKGVPSK